MAEKPPSVPPSAITLTSDDYPKDLLRRDVSGLTSIELLVSATGKIEGTRIIASQPSGLFDTVVWPNWPASRCYRRSETARLPHIAGWLRTSGGKCLHGDFSMPFMDYSSPND